MMFVASKRELRDLLQWLVVEAGIEEGTPGPSALDVVEGETGRWFASPDPMGGFTELRGCPHPELLRSLIPDPADRDAWERWATQQL